MELTVWERMQLNGVLGQQRGQVAHIRQCLQLLDKIELTEGEKEEVGVKQIAPGQVMWSGEFLAEIELTDTEVKFLKGIVDSHGDWPADGRAVALADKFA